MNIFSSKLFGFYLAGLIEADGCILVPKIERSDKKKLYYPSIQISFPLKDFPLAQIIQKTIGHGSIAKKKQSAAYVLSISNDEGVRVVANLINGKMRTPKYYQFENLINFLNKNSFYAKIQYQGINTSSFQNDSWLTGFIEGDGSFSVRTSIKSKYKRISVAFELTQAQITHYGYSSHMFMKEIADFLGTNCKEIRQNHKYPQYRVRTHSIKTNQNIINYLEKYPLKGSKYLDYVDWSKIFCFMKEQTHMDNIQTILQIKSKINQKRTIFHWNHL